MKIASYSIKKIASLTDAKIISESSDTEINFLITDSRALFGNENTLFVAIKGELHDGHDFILDLYKKGIRNFLISDSHFKKDELIDANILLVHDSISALQKWASIHRKNFNIPVVAITGSNGKTVVKEWLFQLLQKDFNIVRSPKSFNSQLGVPLSVLQMEKEHQLALFEAGISMKGEMQKLKEILQPTTGIYTTITHAHSENFKNDKEKAAEKAILFQTVDRIIYNVDNDIVEDAVNSLTVKNKISVGHQRLASLTIGAVVPDAHGNKVQLKWKDENLEVNIPFFDRASTENANLCIAFLLELGFSPEQIKNKIKKISAIEMRLELLKGINNCTVINDVYNSDLSSLEISLDLLNQQKQHSKKTLILSDFIQEKKEPSELYQIVGRLLKDKNIHQLIGIGEEITQFGDCFELEKSFFPNTESFLLTKHSDRFRDEAILVKGARKFKLERIVDLLQQHAHETVLEINLNAIAHNLNYYRGQLYPNTKIMAMVKAFSYGSGSYEIANILEYNRADYLAVAYADEGVELRKNGITLPIMVMNPEKTAFDNLIEYQLEPEIYSIGILKKMEAYLSERGIENYPIHLKLDTGMHRLGFMQSELTELKQIVMNSVAIKVVSVFSHLAASEDRNMDTFTVEQASVLQKCVEELRAVTKEKFMVHILNSSGITRFPKYHFDMVRLGIGMYGVGIDEKENKKLQFPMRLRTIVSQVKTIAKGETIGYGRKGLANEEMKIAILPIGYADGFSRQLSNGSGKVKIKGNWYFTVGNVCMDMIMIDITNSSIQEGDEVIIFDDQNSIQELAKAMNTISYEVLTSVSPRVKRVYFRE